MPVHSELSQPQRISSPRKSAWRFAILALIVSSATFAQTSRPSPFVARGGPSTAQPAAAQAPADAILEFSGVTKIGPSTMVCITTLSDKRTVWIEVGKTENGIQAVSYQPEAGSVTVRQNGREVTLPIKQPSYDPSTLAAYQPTTFAGPAPMAGVAPTVAVTNEEKETEARMLVSDLLEIGMIQRQAYQEAQVREREEKRAAVQANPNGVPPPPTVAPPESPR